MRQTARERPPAERCSVTLGRLAASTRVVICGCCARRVWCGWEYYLDMMIASRDGTPLPDFVDYYPAQQGYYDGLVAQAGQ